MQLCNFLKGKECYDPAGITLHNSKSDCDTSHAEVDGEEVGCYLMR